MLAALQRMLVKIVGLFIVAQYVQYQLTMVKIRVIQKVTS